MQVRSTKVSVAKPARPYGCIVPGAPVGVAEAIHRVVCRLEAGNPGLGTDNLVESLSRIALYPRPDHTIEYPD